MKRLIDRRRPLPILLAMGFLFCLVIPSFEIFDQYVQLVLMYVGINIILAASLNLINGYMGEFSVGHAGFMAVGAYVSSVLTVKVFPAVYSAWLFPAAVLSGGAAAALVGLIVAFPSFNTRGDYLAIVTLAFGMIVKSAVENINYLGGPRGFLGMERLTTLPWVFFWTFLSIWVIRNLVYSNYGRGVLSIREDEIASDLMSVNTRQVKVLTFVFSAFLCGIAGALFAHELQFINPKSFTILKSTDMLVMVYLGGIGSLGGSILGAAVYTLVLEGLRTVLQALGISQEWRLVVAPLMLILLMLYRPKGIMGLREFKFLIPKLDRSDLPVTVKPRQSGEEVTP